MADKKLNEVTKVTDMAYVPVIMADGSIGQIAKADLASVVAELIRNTDIGYKAIPARSGGTAKILVVPKTGRTTIILSLSRYSNTALVVALITIYPVATNECPKVSIDYLRGAKDAGNYTPKIYYVAEADGSISLYVRTAQN